MIVFETPENPKYPESQLEVMEQPDVVITISGAKNIDALHILFKSEDEEEIEDE